MKICVPLKAKQGIGGGWSFTRNFVKALNSQVQFVDSIQDCDIYFIPGSTMTTRDEVGIARKLGKKIVLRIDNIPRNSRNRNTGTSRLYDFAQIADMVIYQSNWAREWVKLFIKKDGPVILNGCDTEIFSPNGEKYEKDGNPQYLYSRYNRDATKGWEIAWHYFQKEYFRNPNVHLWVIGKFNPEIVGYNLDLFGGAEARYKYFGIIEDPKEIAKIYRSVDAILVPYMLEACSNVVF